MPIKSDNSSNGIEELEEGTYPARIVGVVLTGEEENLLEKGKTSIRMVITYEIPSETVTIDEEKRPRHITSFLAASTNEKSNLMKVINSLGDQVPDDLLIENGNVVEIEDVSGLIGLGLTISVEHNKKGKANVKGYSKLRKKELANLEELDNTPYAFDPYLDEPCLEGTIDDIPAWLIKKLSKALDLDDFTDNAMELIETRLEAIENDEDDEEEEKPKKPAKKSKSSSKVKKAKEDKPVKKSKKKAKKPEPEPEPEEDDEDDWDDEEDDED